MFPNDRRALTTVGQNAPIFAWDLETGRQTRRVPLNGASTIAISGDGRRAVAGLDTSVCLWDLETWDEIERFEGHRDAVSHVAFSPDGRRAVSTDRGNTVRVWALPPDRPAGEHPRVAEVAQYLIGRDDLPTVCDRLPQRRSRPGRVNNEVHATFGIMTPNSRPRPCAFHAASSRGRDDDPASLGSSDRDD